MFTGKHGGPAGRGVRVPDRSVRGGGQAAARRHGSAGPCLSGHRGAAARRHGVRRAVLIRASRLRRVFGLRAGAPRAMRKQCPSCGGHRDRDPARPVPRLGIVWHVDDREAAKVLLGLGERPVSEDGRAAARVDAADSGRRVQAAVAEDEDPAAVISLITAMPAAPRSRTSCGVRSGTHSSLKAIRYSAIACSSAHGQPDDCRSPSLRTHLADSTPRPGLSKPSVTQARSVRRRRATALGVRQLAGHAERDVAGPGDGGAGCRINHHPPAAGRTPWPLSAQVVRQVW